MRKICGVYIIKNTKTHNLYVGASIDIKRRWRHHRSKLKNNSGENKRLQKSWNKYGEDFFEFKVIEECSLKNLMTKEKFYIKSFRKETFTYNFTDGGIGLLGFKFPKDELMKRSKMMVGNKRTVGGKGHLGEVSKRKNPASKYFGVIKQIYNGKRKISTYWRARISTDSVERNLGTFATEIEAAKAFDVESWKKYKDLNKLNFPSSYKSIDI